MSDSIIALRGVHLSLGHAAAKVHILRGIDLDVAEGEAVGLIGPSGSGKSSLLSVMTGLEPPSAGSITVAGHELTGLGEDELARFRASTIGIVFQSFHLIPNMRAIENVAVPMEFAGATDAFARAEAMLGRVGLSHRLRHYPAELSGGEQQRVALARALATQPAILFADEPTGNLDGVTGAEIVQLMFDLRGEQGTTLVLVTHDPALAERCDRVLQMADGRFAGDLSRAAAKAAE